MDLTYILYFLISIIILSLVSMIALLIKHVKLNSQYEEIYKQFQYFSIQNERLAHENIEFIRKTEQLTEKIRFQDTLIEEAKKLRQESNDATKAALFELGNQLSAQLIDINKKENAESRKLSEQNIEKTVNKFNSEFERIYKMVNTLDKDITQSRDTIDIIKNSLLSPSGAGALAEITLENILKSSGLKNNIDFHLQYNVSDEIDKTALRPDAIIFLPNSRLMVIDSKASKFLVDQNSDPQKLSKTMNLHLKSLSGKNYAESVKKHLNNKQSDISNIITLMFLPTEHAVEKILDADSQFLNKAWNVDIFPVGPSGLMNMLSFARFQISEQQMAYYNLQIIEEVKKLVASVSTMADHSAKLGNSLSSAVNYYDKFAASFNRNLLSKSKKLSSLGIDVSSEKQEPLKRMQLFTSKSELIELETEELKKIEV
ncbi:MAG: DNA recombination protein RmuC [Rickettsiaceae bacterium]|nr:DNA recombination protein RmuC [Rickettsiaceae bacterium]